MLLITSLCVTLIISACTKDDINSQTSIVNQRQKPVELNTDIFLRRKQGDVLINYENELLLAAQEGLAKDTFFIIPQVNISIDNPIAVVDKYVDRRGTRPVAEAFVQFLYSPEAQREFAKVGFRPFNPSLVQEFASKYPPIQKLFTVESLGGWMTVQAKFFQNGGIFDQIQLNFPVKSLSKK